MTRKQIASIIESNCPFMCVMTLERREKLIDELCFAAEEGEQDGSSVPTMQVQEPS